MLALVTMWVVPIVADEDESETLADHGSVHYWTIAKAAWDKREYKDAAVLAEKIADLNPYAEFALEAEWRAYVTWHEIRPDVKRQARTRDALFTLAARWEERYATIEPDRAAEACWYRALVLDKESRHPEAIDLLQEAERRYPGSASEADICWHLGEGLRDAKRYAEAIEAYRTFRALHADSECAADAVLRIGICYQELHDYPNAEDTWSEFLTNDGFDWHEGAVYGNALEVAQRLKAMGEAAEELRYLQRITNKCDPSLDVWRQANAKIGPPAPCLMIYPHHRLHYVAHTKSIDATSKLMLVSEVSVLLRPQYFPQGVACTGALRIVTKVTMAQVPDNMVASTVDGKHIYTAALQIPDARRNDMGDTWYRFATAPVSVAPPDRLRVTREWVKAGKTWGECTITVQSSARWHIWMWLPTTTNADNFQLNRPNELHDDGRLFRWFDDCPLEQGVVFKVKVPIEVGAGVKEYYPRIKLERGSSDFGNTDQQQKAKVHAATTAELAIALTSEAEILSEYDFPGSIDVMLDEVKR